MKKVILIFSLLISVFIFSSCSNNNDWKTIEVFDFGTIKIPDEWYQSEYNGKVYFSDKTNDEVCLFQSNSFAGDSENETGDVESNIVYDEFQNIMCTKSNVLSNSAIYGECRVSADGNQENKHFVEFYYSDDSCILFISTDNSVTDDIIKKIAESYTAY